MISESKGLNVNLGETTVMVSDGHSDGHSDGQWKHSNDGSYKHKL